MFIAKLNTIRNSLTPTETKIADYMISHLTEIKTITSQQLAVSIGTAQASIIRFSKKLGYNSYRELLAEISSEQVDELIREEIRIDEPISDTVDKICMQVKEIAQITNDINDSKILQDAVNTILNASTHIAFGVGSSNLFAQYFANQLIKLGIQCYTSESAHTIYSLIDNVASNSVLILISESGETREVIKAARLAKEKGIKIISMTKGLQNSLHNYSDILLKTVSFETKTRLNVTTMRCSQLFLVDVVYLLILKQDFENKNKIISRANQLIDN